MTCFSVLVHFIKNAVQKTCDWQSRTDVLSKLAFSDLTLISARTKNSSDLHRSKKHFLLKKIRISGLTRKNISPWCYTIENTPRGCYAIYGSYQTSQICFGKNDEALLNSIYRFSVCPVSVSFNAMAHNLIPIKCQRLS